MDEKPGGPYGSHSAPSSREVAGQDEPTRDLGSRDSQPFRPRFFEDGALVAQRYRVERFIAAGGMGDVYEAEDLDLGARVALKTLRLDRIGDEGATERFKNEILLARKVTHPNVCRIFDVGSHHPEAAGGTGPIVTFLTMELLCGETLSDRLKRSGRFAPEEALPLIEQMTGALAAAHHAGIVHRDFKPANVMLVPTEDGTRAVVMDFGLARGGGRETGLSRPDHVLGTPAYIAPEQLEGQTVTSATDVYALGMVLYEMLTGTLPFTGDSALSVALKRLSDAPSSPRLHVPDLPPLWERTVLKCLERSPKNRFQDVRDVPAALRGEIKLRRLTSSRGKRGLAAVLAAFAVLAAVALAFWWSRSEAGGAGPSAVPVKVRRSLAVLSFQDLSGRPEYAWLSTALQEMCATELAAGDALRVVPGESVSRAQLDLALPHAASLAPDTLAALGRNLGADLVVLGSYSVVPGSRETMIRVDARLQECATGETLASVPVSGSEMDLFRIASETGSALRARLGLAAPPGGSAPARTSLPSGPDAGRYYAEGLVKLRRMEATEAAGFFERAAEKEPGNPMIHAALSNAWSLTGHILQAKEEARRAFDLSGSLPRKERLEVEAQLRCAERDWGKAAEVYQALWGFYPDDLDYGLRLATALSKSGKGREALDTVEQLSRLPAPLSDDPRIDLAEGEAAAALGDWKHQEAAADEAVRKGEALNARQVVARALSMKANCLRRLGRNAEAVEAAERARALYLAVGDLQGAASARTAIAYVRLMEGDLESARKIAEENLGTYRALGDLRGEMAALNVLANAAYSKGRLKEACRYYEEGLAALREVDDPLALTKVLSNLANALQLSGDLEGARRRHEEVLALARQTGDESIPPYANCGLAEIELAEGHPGRAMERYQRALAGFQQTGERSGFAYALFGQGEILFAQDQLPEAEKMHLEALRIREKLGEALSAAESRMSLARLALERGEAQKAEELARESLQSLQEEGPSDTEALALAILARAQSARDRPEEALKTARSAVQELRTAAPESAGYRLTIETAEAEALAGAGSCDAARRRLDALVAEARRQGRVYAGLEAQLALGQVELRCGNRAAGSALLSALQEKASERGFSLIARKAREAMGGKSTKG